jgi:hypothetical protein
MTLLLPYFHGRESLAEKPSVFPFRKALQVTTLPLEIIISYPILEDY